MNLTKKKCDQCLFSKNKIVSDERKAEIIKDCIKEKKYFVCHKGSLKGIHDLACIGYYHYWLRNVLPGLFDKNPYIKRIRKGLKKSGLIS